MKLNNAQINAISEQIYSELNKSNQNIDLTKKVNDKLLLDYNKIEKKRSLLYKASNDIIHKLNFKYKIDASIGCSIEFMTKKINQKTLLKKVIDINKIKQKVILKTITTENLDKIIKELIKELSN